MSTQVSAKLAEPGFILASNSPRRRELLTAAGFRFQIVPSCAEEIASTAFTIRELTAWNAIRKAHRVAQAHPARFVLGADTLVALDGEIFGKPANMEEAADFLRRLSGRTHLVYSAVFICQIASRRRIAFNDLTQVTFRRLTARTIREYLARIQPLDKAGAYAAQAQDNEVIARITGSFSNVVGLPMEKTEAALKSLGIRPDAA